MRWVSGVRADLFAAARMRRAFTMLLLSILYLLLLLLLRHKESRGRKPPNKFDARGWLFSPFFDVSVSALIELVCRMPNLINRLVLTA